MANEFPTIGVGVLGTTGYIGTPYRTELRSCEGVRMVALCARRGELYGCSAGILAPGLLD